MNISIYILTDYISLESKELLQEIENVFTCVTIQWEMIDSESFKQLKKKEDTSPNTLFIVMPSQIFSQSG